MNEKVVEYVRSLGACGDAMEWLMAQKNLAQAWRDCERGDWMLWVLGKQAGEPGCEKRERLVLAACKCARLSLKYVSEDEKRPLVAIQTAERWAKGKATIEEVRTAADDAYAAAAYAAACAAYAPAVKIFTLKKCADIVRSFYPKAPDGSVEA